MIGPFGLELASARRESPIDRHGNRSAPHDSKRSTAGNRRTPRGDRQREAVYRYTNIAGVPRIPLHRHARSRSRRAAARVAEWRVQYLANGQPDIVVRTIVSALSEDGSRKSDDSFRSRGSDAPSQISTIAVHRATDGRSPRSTWRAHAVAHGHVSRKTRSRPGVAEAIVDKERLAAQFLGDLDALDRLDALASQFARVDDSSRAALVHAEVASTAHRFDDARGHLARAALMGGAARGHRAALADDRSGMWRGAR